MSSSKQNHSHSAKVSHHRMKEHRKRNRIRILVCVIASFLLSMMLTVVLAAIAIMFGFFNKEMILNKINESDYYTNAYEVLMDNLTVITDSKGLPSDLLEPIFTEKRVYINGKQFIDNSLDDKDTLIVTDTIDQELTDALTEYYKSQGITVDETIETDIAATIASINSEYSRMVRFQFVDYIRRYKAAWVSILRILIPLLLVLSVGMVILLIKIQKYPHRGMRYIGISLLSAGLINLILPLAALVQKWYNRIDVSPEYYSDFLKDYVHWSTNAFVYTGFICVVFSIACFVGMKIMKNRL
jgi:hypothetical protein